MTTLKNIADKLGVSITTVSRVLNQDKTLSVSEKLRKQIVSYAKKTNYKTPRNRPRVLAKRIYNVAIINWHGLDDGTSDPYYDQIRVGIQQLALKSNINTTMIYRSNNKYNIGIINNFDGLICIGKFSSAQITMFARVSKHIVFVDSSPEESIYDSVVIDFNHAVKVVLNLLLRKKYNSIGYIGGVEQVSSTIRLGERRELVFRDYLYQKNKLNTKFIHIGTFSSESGYRLMKEALNKKSRAEVYFCGNDLIALGALRAINEKGLRIPEDIGLIGFNNNPNSNYTYPPLSTIHVYTEFMGEQALESLVEKIEGRLIPLKKIVPINLVERSTLK